MGLHREQPRVCLAFHPPPSGCGGQKREKPVGASWRAFSSPASASRIGLRTFDPFASSVRMNLPVSFDYWTRTVGQSTKSSALKRAGVHPHSAPAGERNVGSNRMPMNEAEDSRATITADQWTPVALNSSSLPVPPGFRPAIKLCVGQTTAPVNSLIVFARVILRKRLLRW